MIGKSLRWTIIAGLSLFLQAGIPHGTDFRTAISGRFIMVHANCAGFNFINKKVVLWTNELASNDPDTLMIRWLDAKTFMTRSIHRTKEHCPPSVDLYRVISFDGRLLTLKRIWTGWSDPKDDNDSGDYKLQLVKKV